MSMGSLFGVQALFQAIPVDAKDEESWVRDWLPDSSWMWALSGLLVFLIVVAGAGVLMSRRKTQVGPIASGITPTLALVVPAFTIWLLVLKYAPSPGGEFENGKILLLATVMALAVWAIAAIWRGMQSTPRDVTPEIYERMITEYLALRDMPDGVEHEDISRPPTADVAPVHLKAMAGPLPPDRIDPYLDQIGAALGFINRDFAHLPSARAWNMGTGYLEVQSRLDYARDSLIAHETDKASLLAHTYNLEMRLDGSHFSEASRIAMRQMLDTAKGRISDDPTTNKEYAYSLYTIASALSAYAYDRQRSLLRLRNQQHWLVVVVQFIGAFLLAGAVLAGAKTEAIAAAIIFSLVGSASGILSLLQVRQTGASPDLGEDYGLFRVELARAFTLSGMAAMMAVFLIANLPVLVGTDVFDPPTDVSDEEGPPENGTPDTDQEETGRAQPVFAFAEPVRSQVLAQDQPGTEEARDTAEADDQNATVETHWRALEDIYSFANLGGLLVALIAGWVPERLFRQLTDYGSRLRLDIQSVSKLDG
jgi:hypothetical protein